MDAANNLANRINKIIKEVRSKQFAGLTNATSKDLWAAVKGKHNKLDVNKHSHVLSAADLVDKFFAIISTDYIYCTSKIVALLNILN
jgi:hypothetical protein